MNPTQYFYTAEVVRKKQEVDRHALACSAVRRAIDEAAALDLTEATFSAESANVTMTEESAAVIMKTLSSLGYVVSDKGGVLTISWAEKV